jgi:hypothetical protein
MSVDLGDVCVSTYMCGCLFSCPCVAACASSLSLLKFMNYAHSSTPTTRPKSHTHNRSVRMHHSRLCPKHCAPGGRSGTAHMAMHIAHSSATYGSAHRAPLAHRRSLRAVRTLSLSQSCPIPPQCIIFKVPQRRMPRKLDADRGAWRSGRRPVILIFVPSISGEA